MVINLTLISKPGCHLCDVARDSIAAVVKEFMKINSTSEIRIEELNILEDQALQEKYAEQIPVLLLDGKMHNYWRMDEERLMRALHAKARG